MMEHSTNGRRPEGEQMSEESRPNALAAFQTMMAFLEEDGWRPQRIEDKFVCRMNFRGDHARIICFAQIRVDLEQFFFYAVAPIMILEPARPAVAEFLTRANYGMLIGNFELDFGDGEVRYKSALDFEGETLTPAWIRNAIYPAVDTLDRYMPGLLAVAFGNTPPAQAIAEIEGK